MMIAKNYFLLIAILVCNISFAQQNVGFRANIVSPVINEGGEVTFKLRAPFARTVSVNGDWAASGGSGQMTMDVTAYGLTQRKNFLLIYISILS